jgi:very-short-patch-repair endonuclease
MSIDDDLHEVAERQHGVVAKRQARDLGLDRRRERCRVGRGDWEEATSRVLRRRGAPETAEQRLMVAVLHAGPDGLASHESAAWLWRIPGFAECHVVLRPRPHGADLSEGHRPTLVLPHHRTSVRGIPCATLARTVFDLAGTRLSVPRMQRIVHILTSKSPALLPTLHQTLDELAGRGRTGIATMRTVLDDLPIGSIPAASGLELRFEEIARHAGVRGLERQVDVGGHGWLPSDYLRRDVKLIVEVDSRLHHTSPLDVAGDAAGDQAMLAAGWHRVLRVYEEDIWHRPWFVAEQLVTTIRELGPKTDSSAVGFGTENEKWAS